MNDENQKDTTAINMRRCDVGCRGPEMSLAVVHALRQLIDQMWPIEEAHFRWKPSEQHPYRMLVLLDRWLHGIIPIAEFGLPNLNSIVADDAGVCTLCGARDATLNLGNHNWSVCWKHQTCWCIGFGCFDDLDYYEESFPYPSNWEKIQRCRVVEPWHPLAVESKT